MRYTWVVVTIFLAATSIVYHKPVLNSLDLILNYDDPAHISSYRLNRLDRDAYEQSLEKALEQENFSVARNIIALADDQTIRLRTELTQRADPSLQASAIKNSTDFLKGAFAGDTSNATELGGAIVSDLTGIGDIRDIIINGTAAIKNENYSKTTLGLAVVGLALSGGMVLTAGASTQTTVGVSFLKNAVKAGVLTPSLRKKIVDLSTKLVDLKSLKLALKNVSLENPKISQKFLRTAIRYEIFDEISVIAKHTGRIMRVGGLGGSFAVLKHAKTTKDLKRFSQVSARFKHKTSAVIGVLGPAAITIGGLMMVVFSWMFAALIWLTGAIWVVYKLVRFISLKVSIRR